MLTNKQIESFREMFKTEFCVDISHQEAKIILEQSIIFYQTILGLNDLDVIKY